MVSYSLTVVFVLYGLVFAVKSLYILRFVHFGLKFIGINVTIKRREQTFETNLIAPPLVDNCL